MPLNVEYGNFVFCVGCTGVYFIVIACVYTDFQIEPSQRKKEQLGA